MPAKRDASPPPPLHQRLIALLRREVGALEPGAQLPSQNELARRHGASVLTIREALSVLAAEGTIERRPGSGTYVVDPALNQWAAVVTDLDVFNQFTSYSFREMIRAARDVLTQKGHKVRVYPGTVEPGVPIPSGKLTSCDAFMEDVSAGRVRGAVLIAAGVEGLVAKLDGLEIPVVDTERRGRYGVVHDHNEAALSMGLEHLASQGRRRVAFMSWGNAGAIVSATRGHGIDLRPEWMRCDLFPGRPGSGWREFREIWNAREEKPDGLIVLDDSLFIDAIPAIMQQGIRVPEDLMVVATLPRGMHVFVPMPIVRLENDPAFVGVQAAAVLDQLLRGEKPERERWSMPTKLVVG